MPNVPCLFVLRHSAPREGRYGMRPGGEGKLCNSTRHYLQWRRPCTNQLNHEQEQGVYFFPLATIVRWHGECILKRKGTDRLRRIGEGAGNHEKGRERAEVGRRRERATRSALGSPSLNTCIHQLESPLPARNRRPPAETDVLVWVDESAQAFGERVIAVAEPQHLHTAISTLPRRT